MSKFRLGQTNFLSQYPNNFIFEKIGNSEKYIYKATFDNATLQTQNFINFLANIDTIPNFLFIDIGKSSYLFDKYDKKLINLGSGSDISASSGDIAQIARYLYTNNVGVNTFFDINKAYTTDNTTIEKIYYSNLEKLYIIERNKIEGDNTNYLAVKVNETITLEKGGYRIGCGGSMMLTTTDSDEISSDNAYEGAFIAEPYGSAFFQINETVTLKIVVGCLPITGSNIKSYTRFKITKVV